MTVLAALKGCYDRLADDSHSSIAPYGYSEEKISFALILDRDGRLLEIVDLRDTTGKKPAPRALQVPQSFKRPGTTPRSFFLWDKTSFVLGVGGRPKDRSEEHHAHRLAEEHATFKSFHAQVLAGVEDEGLRALLAFLERWTPEQIGTLDHKDDLLQNPNLVFRLDGERGFLHQRPAARALWAARLAASRGGEGLCLVSGERETLARLHPSIKGVRGGQTAGGSIVSFNLDAFTSYGKEQGGNAPVSEVAAFAYTTALNLLLRPGSRNRVQIADASTVFWAESAAPAEEALVWSLFEPPTDDDGPGQTKAEGHRFDAGEAAEIRSILNQIAKGRPLKDAAPSLRDGTRFFVLGLAPNAARIAVRFWHEDSLGHLAERFGEHLRDLAIEPSRQSLPAIWRLFYETAVQRKAENIPPNLSGEVMRAILTGNRYPRALLAAVIMRMRADSAVNGLRAAICKACLNRDSRLSGRKEDVPVSLDKSELNPGYRLGRLFAVLEAAQVTALGNVNATIRDRYYGAAAATPTSVFPLLMKNYKNHLKNVRTKKGERLGNWYEKRVGEIVDGLAGIFPRSLSLEDQGRFAIGYYHEREGVYRKKDPDAPAELTDADQSVTSKDEE